MKTVCEYNKCTGCMACIQKCPKAAIRLVDSLDANNMFIDANLCINCSACYKVCQVNNTPEFYETKYWLQGWHKKENIRNESSSGGAATALAMTFILNGGVVCSCTYKAREFIFEYANNVNEVKKFGGSKYVKSNPECVYRKNLEILKMGKSLLFIGLPCQVSGMKNFIGEKYNSQIYYVELICHGSPSPKVFEKFLQSNGINLFDIEDIRFRKKTNFCISSNDSIYSKILPDGIQDLYTFTFLNGVTYTENCYSCQYARTERIADITLGDSWGSDLSDDEKSKGISLIMCQTEKGYQLVKESELHIEPVNREKSIQANKQLSVPSKMPQERTVFFEVLKNKRFDYAVYKAYPKKYIKYCLKKFIYHFKNEGKINNSASEYCITYLKKNK